MALALSTPLSSVIPYVDFKNRKKEQEIYIAAQLKKKILQNPIFKAPQLTMFPN